MNYMIKLFKFIYLKKLKDINIKLYKKIPSYLDIIYSPEYTGSFRKIYNMEGIHHNLSAIIINII